MFRSSSMVLAAAAIVLVTLTAAAGRGETPPPDGVRPALVDLNNWLDAHGMGPGWRKYLRTDALEAILKSPETADPAAVAAIVRQYASGAPETDRPRYLRVRRALESWLAQLPPPSQADLPAAVEKAKEAFVPRTAADVAAARQRLLDALQRLEAVLGPSHPEAVRWREYLQWDRLLEQLANSAGPDFAALDEIYARYAAGHEGLDMAPFDDVRRALYAYVTTARAVADTDLPAQYRQLMAALPEHIESYRQKPSADGAAALSAAIQWLDEAGQSPWIAAALRQHFTRPNLFAAVDASVVAAGIEEPIDEVGPVRDCILGATIRGTGHTLGQISVELVPNDHAAEICTVFRGTVASNSTGYSGPARVFTSGVTNVQTRKPLYVDDQGFRAGPARSEADTSSRIRGVSAGRGGVIERAATKRAYQQKSQAERISAQHAEAQANRRADQQALELIADAQQSFVSDFREPLEARKLFPKQFRFSTTAEEVLLTGLQTGPYDLGAPGPPPAAVSGLDISARVHESMVNNFAEEAFAGMILTEKQFRDTMLDVLGEVPEQFAPDQGQEPWKITFARSQPITVSLSDGALRIVVRGRRYVSGESSYPGMDVTAVYSIVEGDSGPKAVRQGELAIFPPGFDPGGSRRLSVREQTIRRMLERRFGKIFEPEIVPDPLKLPGRWERTGDYGLKHWEVAEGWMLLGWKRIPGSESPEAAAPQAVQASN